MSDNNMVTALTQIARMECMAQVHAESGDLVKRNTKRLLDKGVTGPEGLAMSHTEAAEEEAVMRVTTLAGQVGCPIQVGIKTIFCADDLKTKLNDSGRH